LGYVVGPFLEPIEVRLSLGEKAQRPLVRGDQLFERGGASCELGDRFLEACQELL
jgi:hypothetical protein